MALTPIPILKMLTLQSFGIFLIFTWAAIGACLDTTIPCAALSVLLPGKVSYPASPIYLASIISYFWGQEKLAPACIVTPTRAQDVSIAVRALAAIHAYDRNAPPLAIRSGGHSPLAGSANNNGGVTMDLTSLNSITISGDKSVVSVGAGSLWQNIYAQLDPLGIAVGGGRVAGIGVGGFLTGGQSDTNQLSDTSSLKLSQVAYHSSHLNLDGYVTKWSACKSS